MLWNLDGDEVDHLPHDEDYRRRARRLPPGLEATLRQQVNEHCDRNREVRAAWLFGVPSFEEAYGQVVTALGSSEEANLFLGQILWEVLRHRADVWRFYRPEGGLDHPAGMHYWRDEGASVTQDP